MWFGCRVKNMCLSGIINKYWMPAVRDIILLKRLSNLNAGLIQFWNRHCCNFRRTPRLRNRHRSSLIQIIADTVNQQAFSRRVILDAGDVLDTWKSFTQQESPSLPDSRRRKSDLLVRRILKAGNSDTAPNRDIGDNLNRVGCATKLKIG